MLQGTCICGGGALYPGGRGDGARAGVSGPGAGVSGAADAGVAGATCSAPSIVREPEQEQRIGRTL